MLGVMRRGEKKKAKEWRPVFKIVEPVHSCQLPDGHLTLPLETTRANDGRGWAIQGHSQSQ